MDDGIKFKATTEWMATRYAEMNDRLFGGKLGKCNFAIFTTGRGSQGSVLGWFKIKGRGIKVNRYDRRLFKTDIFYSEKIYVNNKNFYELCQPTIELNGHYSGTESSLLATLVHEMCHYYTYMHGFCPKQGHGREFKEIGMIVSSRSNGMFTIQRIASAEEMKGYELDADMQAKRDARLANKKSIVSAVIAFHEFNDKFSKNETRLTMTSSDRLINLIKTTEEARGNKVIVTNDANVIDYLFNKGYRKNCRTWRYWNLEDKPWINEFKAILGSEGSQPIKQVAQTVPSRPTNNPKIVFSIKTNKGVFETECSSLTELREKLQQRFPNLSYDTITNLMNNKANFKNMNEDKKMINTMKIVESVVNEFLENEFGNNDTIEITPNMDLGQMSPLEME